MSGGYYFIFIPTGYCWAVDDPVNWLLQHADCPFFGPARERLLLSPDDPARLLRVVVRRCRLALVHFASEGQVVVHYWSEAPDLRPFMKKHGLARNELRVALLNRKTEQIVVRPGTDFLYGEAVRETFSWQLFQARFEQRHVEEADDWQVAPDTWGTLCWERASSERMIPWAALKSVWRRDAAPLCPNCDTPLVVVRFVWVLPIMFSGIRRITRGCFWCRREFEELVDGDFWGWLVKHLNPDVLPTHQYGTRKYDLRCRHASRAGEG